MGGSTRWSRNAGAAHQSPSASASTSRPCRVLGDIGAPRSSPLRASWSRSHLDRVTYVSRDAALCFLGPILDPRAAVDVCSNMMSQATISTDPATTTPWAWPHTVKKTGATPEMTFWMSLGRLVSDPARPRTVAPPPRLEPVTGFPTYSEVTGVSTSKPSRGG